MLKGERDIFSPWYISGAEQVAGTQFGLGSGPIFLDQLVCSESDENLLECRKNSRLGLHSCDHKGDVGVRCAGEHLRLLLLALTKTSTYMYMHMFCVIMTFADIDECYEDTHGCSHYCNNTIGSYFCYCLPGYELDADSHSCNGMQNELFHGVCFSHVLTVSDIDECMRGTDMCHENATCSNINGSYLCSCNPGWSGNGVNCSSKTRPQQILDAIIMTFFPSLRY